MLEVEYHFEHSPLYDNCEAATELYVRVPIRDDGFIQPPNRLLCSFCFVEPRCKGHRIVRSEGEKR